MRKPVWEFRIPTIVALLVVAASIWVTGSLVRTGTFVVGHASPDSTPQHITATNIGDTSAEIVFITTSLTTAAVKVSDGKSPDRVVFQNNEQTPLTTHRIVLSDLAPQTSYTYSLVIDGKTYTDQNYTFTTGSPITPNTQVQTVSGTLLLPTSEGAKDVLVTLESSTSQILSTVTDIQGGFTFDLSSLRTKNLAALDTVTDDTVLTLNAYFADQHSSVITRFDNAQPLPTLTLSQDYDFTQTAIETSTSSAQTTFVLPSPIATQTTGLTITSPTNNSNTIDSQPVFKGTGTKEKDVQISISPADIKDTTPTDASGHWRYRPTTPLPQGSNTLTVTAVDENGVTKIATSTFTVFPSGSQIAQSATPSASTTPTPTAQPTVTASPTPTVIVTPTHTIVTPSPTTVVTIPPTTTPEPTLISSPTPTAFVTVTPPPTGSVSAVLISLASVILIITGTTLLFIL